MRKQFLKYDVAFLLIFDISAIFLCSFLSVRFFSDISLIAYLQKYPQELYIVFVTIVIFYFFDLYYTLKDFRRYRQIINLTLAISIAFCVVWMASFFDTSFVIGRKALLLSFGLFFVMAAAIRVIFSFLSQRVFIRNALIVGDAEIVRTLVSEIEGPATEKEKHSIGIHIAGYLSSKENTALEKYAPRLGDIPDLEKVMEQLNISLIIYALNVKGDARANEFMLKEKLKGVHLVSAIALYESILGRVSYEHIDSSWLIEECLRGNKFTEVKLKRLLDVILGSIFFILCIPVILFLALLIKIESRGPAFFVQDRIGQNGRIFKMYKMRTMENIDTKELETGAEEWHSKNVHRVTRLGKILRKTRLDEILQFFNVIKGDMSIVGPRPEMEMFIDQCEDRIPFYRLRLAVKPGITGWAQIWHGHTSTLKGYKKKFEYDLYYLSHLSLRLDLEIMLRTAFIGFLGKGK